MKIGPYAILEELGQGGFGNVYKGRHERTGRIAAVKTLHKQFAEHQELVERFFQETVAAIKLHHPSITQIWEVDTDPATGRHYFAMQFHECVDLKEVIRKRQPLSYKHKVDIIIQVAEGLAYAHSNKVVHRDIKPGNILLLHDGTIKIIDFGIAKVHLPDVELSMTGTQLWLGTVAYAAPEQFQNAKDVDGRADIFALGVVAYELLTQRKPFTGDSDTEVRLNINTSPLPPMPELAGSGWEWVEGVLRHAMAKDRKQRFVTAQAFADALRRGQEDDVTQQHGHDPTKPRKEFVPDATLGLRPGKAEDVTQPGVKDSGLDDVVTSYLARAPFPLSELEPVSPQPVPARAPAAARSASLPSSPPSAGAVGPVKPVAAKAPARPPAAAPSAAPIVAREPAAPAAPAAPRIPAPLPRPAEPASPPPSRAASSSPSLSAHHKLRERIEQLVREAREMFEAGQVELARSKAETARSLDAESREAKSLLRRIEDRIQQQAREAEERRRIQGLLEEARQQEEHGDLTRAEKLVLRALDLRRDDPAASAALTRITRRRDSMEKRRREAERLVEEARKLLASGRFLPARKSCQRALELEPGLESAPRLLAETDRAQQADGRRRRKARVQALKLAGIGLGAVAVMVGSWSVYLWIKPTAAAALVKQAKELAAQGKHEEAWKGYQDAVEVMGSAERMKILAAVDDWARQRLEPEPVEPARGDLRFETAQINLEKAGKALELPRAAYAVLTRHGLDPALVAERTRTVLGLAANLEGALAAVAQLRVRVEGQRRQARAALEEGRRAVSTKDAARAAQAIDAVKPVLAAVESLAGEVSRQILVEGYLDLADLRRQVEAEARPLREVVQGAEKVLNWVEWKRKYDADLKAAKAHEEQCQPAEAGRLYDSHAADPENLEAVAGKARVEARIRGEQEVVTGFVAAMRGGQNARAGEFIESARGIAGCYPELASLIEKYDVNVNCESSLATRRAALEAARSREDWPAAANAARELRRLGCAADAERAGGEVGPLLERWARACIGRKDPDCMLHARSRLEEELPGSPLLATLKAELVRPLEQSTIAAFTRLDAEPRAVEAAAGRLLEQDPSSATARSARAAVAELQAAAQALGRDEFPRARAALDAAARVAGWQPLQDVVRSARAELERVSGAHRALLAAEEALQARNFDLSLAEAERAGTVPRYRPRADAVVASARAGIEERRRELLRAQQVKDECDQAASAVKSARKQSWRGAIAQLEACQKKLEALDEAARRQVRSLDGIDLNAAFDKASLAFACTEPCDLREAARCAARAGKQGRADSFLNMNCDDVTLRSVLCPTL